MKNHVGTPKQAQSFYSEQFGIARARSHQIYLAVHTVTLLSSFADSLSVDSSINVASSA